MRPIKFRGKRINGGEWVESMTISYGTIKRKMNDVFFEIYANKWVGVIPETVGQFIGMIDINGKEIYEGDIVRIDDIHPIASIVYETKNASFDLQWLGKDKDDVCMCYLSCYTDCGIEVIGNIHDNPEFVNESLCTN